MHFQAMFLVFCLVGTCLVFNVSINFSNMLFGDSYRHVLPVPNILENLLSVHRFCKDRNSFIARSVTNQVLTLPGNATTSLMLSILIPRLIAHTCRLWLLRQTTILWIPIGIQIDIGATRRLTSEITSLFLHSTDTEQILLGSSAGLRITKIGLSLLSTPSTSLITQRRNKD